MARWQPISTCPKGSGKEYLVGCNVADVWIVRSASYDDGSMWDIQDFTSKGDAEGWWSYSNSVSQDKLEGLYAPTYWAPMPDDQPT